MQQCTIRSLNDQREGLIMRRATVLLADDHAIVTDGLFSLLKEQFDVVGAVANGTDLVAEATRLRPDVIVADISMPELSGLEALRQLRAKRIDAKFIFLTMHGDAHIATKRCAPAPPATC